MMELASLMPVILAAAEATESVQEAAAQGGFSFNMSSVAFAWLGGLLAAGLVVIGAGRGIGTLAGTATESIARQPEAGGRIFTTMIIAAALIEGIALFALVICFLAVTKTS